MNDKNPHSSHLAKLMADRPETVSAAIREAKLALLDAVKNRKVAPLVGTLNPTDAGLEKIGLDAKQRKTLLGNSSALAMIGELLMRAEKKREIQKTLAEKEKHKKEKDAQKNKNAGIKQANQDGLEGDPEKARENDEGFDEFELPKAEHDEFEPEAEFDGDEVELGDLKELSHDNAALNEMDIQELQGDLLQEIKTLPSLGDQSALMFIVSQLDVTNMAFRTEGAAHLMQNAANGLLEQADQILAFAGVQALHDPQTSPFVAALGDVSSAASATNAIAPKNDDELNEIAAEQAHTPHAPFTLIANENGGSAMNNAAGFTPISAKDLFLENILLMGKNDAIDVPQQPAYEAPAKAKSVFGDLELKMPAFPGAGGASN